MRYLVVLLLQAVVAQAGTYVIAAGVEQYDDPQISALSYAVADAKSVAAAFRASGASPRDVTVLTSDSANAARRPSRINLLRAFGAVKSQAKTDDKLIFFFAGHGVERGDEHYLLGVDTQRDLLEETALSMTVVSKALEGLPCGEVLFLIDACRNDPAAGRGAVDATLSDGLARGLRPHLTDAATRPRLVATLLACDAGQRAWEAPESGHGAFSLFLAKGLGGQAAAANGEVSLSGLAAYVEREVSGWAERSKHAQRPRLINPDGGDMVILKAPPEPVVSVAFKNDTLAQVIDLLAEQFSAQIVLGPGADPGLTVTGRLDNQPLGTVLKVLVAAHRLSVRRDGKIYIIEAPGAAPLVTEPPGQKAWHIDSERRFVDRNGQPVFPVMVMGLAEDWDPPRARAMATGLQAAGVEAVLLRLNVKAAKGRQFARLSFPLVPSELDQDLAGVDCAVAAFREAGLKCVLALNLLPGSEDVTPTDSPLWSDAATQANYLEICATIAARYRGAGDTLVGLQPLDSPLTNDVAGYAHLMAVTAARIRLADPDLPLVFAPPYRHNRDWTFALPENAMNGGEVVPYDDVEEMSLVLRPGACRLLFWRDSSSRTAPPDLAALERQMAPCRALNLIPIYCYYTLSEPAMPTAFAAFREQVLALRGGQAQHAPEQQALARPPAQKAWHIDAARRFVDRNGQPVFPLMVMGVAERWDLAGARSMASGLRAAGVEAVMLRLNLGGSESPYATLPLPVVPDRLDQDLAGVDHALAAFREAGIPCLLSLNVLRSPEDGTPSDSLLWSDADTQAAYIEACAAIATRYREAGDTLVGMVPIEQPSTNDAPGYAELVARAANRVREVDPQMALVFVPPAWRLANWTIPPLDNAMSFCATRPDDDLATIRSVVHPGALRMLYWATCPSRTEPPDLASLDSEMAACRALQLIPVYACWLLTEPTMPTAFAAFREQFLAMRGGQDQRAPASR